MSLLESWNAVVVEVYATTTSKDIIAVLTIHWDRLVLQKQKAGVSATALLAQSSQMKPKLICVNPNCRCTSHLIENCYWRAGKKEGQFPPNFHNRSKTNTPAQSNTTTIPKPMTESMAANVALVTPPQAPTQLHGYVCTVCNP